MSRRNVFLFVLATGVSFAVFAAVAFGLQFIGLFGSSEPNTPSALDTQEQAWQALGLTDYRIEVRRIDSIWHAQTYVIVVQDNQVVGHTTNCTPAPFEGRYCSNREYDAADYTVLGLFASARDLTERRDADTVTITFDSTYHFPTRIGYNDPQLLDEDTYWQVLAFEPQ